MDGLVIAIDTREQEPYGFDPSRVTTVRRALPAGDYSLAGRETSVAVERKTLDDFVATAIHARERFARELRRLAAYDLACVVVEAQMEDVLRHRYVSGADPRSVFGAVLSIVVDHRVPVFFCGDRQVACRFVEDFLALYHRRKASP
ncbi:MAG: ERCC4 domain-containing protein [Planctomycetes bacterium]|nr:ERCC4 domain-containing protein [Planctomycetota bacterium]